MQRATNETIHLQMLFCQKHHAENLKEPNHRDTEHIDAYLAEELANSLLRVETIQRSEALEISTLAGMRSSARHTPAAVASLLHYRRRAAS